MKKLFSIFSLVLLFAAMAYGQAALQVPITLSDGIPAHGTFALKLGLDPAATDGIDVGLGEAGLPPAPPTFEGRWTVTGGSSYWDFKNAPSFPYTGVKNHLLVWKYDDDEPGTALSIHFVLPVGAVMTIKDNLTGGSLINSGDLSLTGDYTLAMDMSPLRVQVTYTNVALPVFEPVFSASPASLGFGSVNVGANALLPVTVTNSGNLPLNISGVVSSDPQYTFTSDPFPIAVAPGANTVFNVTFTPTLAGTQPATLTFTHNATGSPTVYNVTGIGYVPAPVFSIAPAAPLGFGLVGVGSTPSLPVTVTNTGDLPLVISGIASSDPQFTFAPNTFPVNIPVGGNAVFNVTFAPLAAGVVNANLTFTHNAAGSPNAYAVTGEGFTVSPVFGVNPTTWDFGSHGTSTNTVKNFVVTNTGNADLVISNVAADLPVFTVSPSVFPITVAPGGTQIFAVTFTPTAAIAYNGVLTFTHNAGAPSTAAVSGAGVAFSGLIPVDENVYSRLEDTVYVEPVQLVLTAGSLQALQFTVLMNRAAGDEAIVSFRNITKGTDVANPNWILEYKVFRAGSADTWRDSIKVLLYNLQNGEMLPPGVYTNLFNISYVTRNLPAGVDSQRTSIQIVDAYGSNDIGQPVDVMPNPSTRGLVNIWVTNRVQSLWGDVNLDGYVDILDLIMVVDHIVGRDSLNTDLDPGYPSSQFTRANIAPWVFGDAVPTPDNVVNVQDLSLIQWIILNQMYPNFIELQKRTSLAKVSDASAKVSLYVTNAGINVRVNSTIGIRGAQLEFGKISGSTSGMTITSPLKGAYYLQAGTELRVLMYDGTGEAFIPAGDYALGNMPFSIQNPKNITLDNVVLVSTETQKIQNIQVEFIYSSEVVPTGYTLSQNYPNPFNPSTAVEFSVPQKDNVTIKIYDMLGQEVRTLFTGTVEGGVYKVQWDGLNDSGALVNSGAYVYRMTASDFNQSKKMVFLK